MTTFTAEAAEHAGFRIQSTLSELSALCGDRLTAGAESAKTGYSLGKAPMAKDALVSEDLAKKFAAEKETPYTRWVRAEGLDLISSTYVPNLHHVELKP